jgi:hypothetical protein
MTIRARAISPVSSSRIFGTYVVATYPRGLLSTSSKFEIGQRVAKILSAVGLSEAFLGV